MQTNIAGCKMGYLKIRISYWKMGILQPAMSVYQGWTAARNLGWSNPSYIIQKDICFFGFGSHVKKVYKMSIAATFSIRKSPWSLGEEHLETPGVGHASHDDRVHGISWESTSNFKFLAEFLEPWRSLMLKPTLALKAGREYQPLKLYILIKERMHFCK